MSGQRYTMKRVSQGLRYRIYARTSAASFETSRALGSDITASMIWLCREVDSRVDVTDRNFCSITVGEAGFAGVLRESSTVFSIVLPSLNTNSTRPAYLRG